MRPPLCRLLSRPLSLLYAVLAYAAFAVTQTALVGFSGNLGLPRSVDVGPARPWSEALGVDLLLIALFGLQHSVMARQGFKRWWTRVVPPALERSTYVLATCAVLLALMGGWRPIPSPVVWQVDHGAGVALLWVLFAAGWGLALASTFQIDHLALFGLRQAFAPPAAPAPPARFETPLLYRHVRHPLYAGLMLSLWAVPRMTAGRLLFALGLSAYVLVGIAFEERDLLRSFGERYRRYRAQVGMLLPRPARRGPCTGER